MKRLLVAALLLLPACVPTEQSFEPAPEAKPQLAADVFHAEDGASLPTRSWLPAGKPRAIIVALHGFNDYSHAFETTGEFFKKRGVAVYAYDQRGFGKAPEHGIWANQDNLTGDLKAFIRSVSARYPRTPIYVLGESMGGAVAIAAAAEPDFPPVKGLILTAPAVWGNGSLNPIYRSSLWFTAHTLPFYELTGRNLHILASNNIPMLRRLGADPVVIKSTRVDAIYGLVHLMDTAYENAGEVRVPVMVLYGGHDQVIPHEPIDETLAHFTCPVTYAYYPDSYHMLLRDLQGEDLMKDIQSWMLHPKKPLPSGVDARAVHN